MSEGKSMKVFDKIIRGFASFALAATLVPASAIPAIALPEGVSDESPTKEAEVDEQTTTDGQPSAKSSETGFINEQLELQSTATTENEQGKQSPETSASDSDAAGSAETAQGTKTTSNINASLNPSGNKFALTGDMRLGGSDETEALFEQGGLVFELASDGLSASWVAGLGKLQNAVSVPSSVKAGSNEVVVNGIVAPAEVRAAANDACAENASDAAKAYALREAMKTAFDDPAVVSIALPSTIESAEWEALAAYSSLARITIDENDSYWARNGVVYSSASDRMEYVCPVYAGDIEVLEGGINPVALVNVHPSARLTGSSVLDGVAMSPDGEVLAAANANAIPKAATTLGEASLIGLTGTVYVLGNIDGIAQWTRNEDGKLISVGAIAEEGVDVIACAPSVAGAFENAGVKVVTPNDDVLVPGSTFTEGDWIFEAQSDMALKASWAADQMPTGEVSVPASAKGLPVKELAEGALAGAEGMTSIVLPKGLRVIGSRALQGCLQMTSLTIPEGVSSLGESALADCTSLKGVSLPSTLAYVGSHAFAGLQNATVACISDRIELDPTALLGASSTTLCVPAAAAGAWRSALPLPAGSVSLATGDASSFINATELSVGEEVALSDLFEVSASAPAKTFWSYPSSVSIDAEAGLLRGECVGNGEVAALVIVNVPGCGDVTIARASVSLKVNVSATGVYSANTLSTEDGTDGGAEETPSTDGANDANEADDAAAPMSLLRATALNDSGSSLRVPPEGAFTISVGVLTYETVDHGPNLGTYAVQLRDDEVTGDIEIPDNINGIAVTTIYDNAFSSPGITSVSIPASVVDIQSNPFDDALNLTAITVDDSNSEYEDKDGILWTRDGKEIINYPSARVAESVKFIGNPAVTRKTAYVYNGATTIREHCFYKAPSVEDVVLPFSLTSIGEYGIDHCESLQFLDVPTGIKTLPEHFLNGCTNLDVLSVGKTVKSLPANSFNDNPNLAQVRLGADMLSSIPKSSFAGTTTPSSITVYLNHDSSNYVAMQKVWSDRGAFVLSSWDALVLAKYEDTKKGIAAAYFNYDHIGTGAVFIPKTSLGSDGKRYNLTCMYDNSFTTTKISSFYLPSTLLTIEGSPFDQNGRCTAYYVEKGNPNYSSYDPVSKEESGILMDDESKVLIKYPGSFPEKNVNVPESIEYINQDAVSYVMAMETFSFPSSLVGISCAEIGKNYGFNNNGFNFRDCPKLKYLDIPDGVTCGFRSSWSANCESFESLTLGNGITSFQTTPNECGNMLAGASNLKTIVVRGIITTVDTALPSETKKKVKVYLPDNAGSELIDPWVNDGFLRENIHTQSSLLTFSADGMGDGECNVSFNTSSTTVPVSVRIPEEATVTLANGTKETRKVTTMKPGSFCTSLFTSLYIPKTITRIEANALAEATGCQSFLVDPENTTFYSKDGVLYGIKNGVKTAILMKWPIGKAFKKIDLTSAEKLYRLAPGAIAFDPFVEEVSLPTSLAQWGSQNFLSCPALKTLELPDSVRGDGVSGSTIKDCASLQSIVLGSGMTEVPKGGMCDLPLLRRIDVKGDMRTAIPDNCFTGVSKSEVDVYVPAGDTDAVTSARVKVWTDAGFTRVHVVGETGGITYKTVTFNSLGGSAVATQNVKSGTLVTKPGDPEREGFTFGGWFMDYACTKVFNFKRTLAQNFGNDSATEFTLYAKWAVDESKIYRYTVYHYTQKLGKSATPLNDENYKLEEQTTHSQQGIGSVTPPTKTIEGFTAPEKTSILLLSDGSAFVKYYYTRNSYKLSYKSIAGLSTEGSTKAGSVQYGAEVTVKVRVTDEVPWISPAGVMRKVGSGSATTIGTGENAGSIADGVYTYTTTMGAGTTVYTPRGTPRDFKINYNYENGTAPSAANPTSVNFYSSKFTLNNPTRDGYDFAGWTVTGLHDSSMVTTSGVNTTFKTGTYGATATTTIICTAKWTGKTYAIKFNANGGTLPDALNNATINPVWDKANWTVPNDKPTYIASNEDAAAIGATGDRKTKFDFLGWSTTKNAVGTGKADQDLAPGKNVKKNVTNNAQGKYGATATLYAVWAPHTATNITLNAGGGVFSDSASEKTISHTYNVATALPTSTATGAAGATISRRGYTFKGWLPSTDSTAAEADTQAQKPTSIPKDSIAADSYKAIWERNKFTVKFSGGTPQDSPAQFVTMDASKVDCGKATETFNSNVTPVVMSVQYVFYDANDVGFKASEQKIPSASTVFKATGYTAQGKWNGAVADPGGIKNVTTINTLYNNGNGVTLTAQWSVNKGQITYEGLEGATTTNPSEYTYEQEVTLTNPTKGSENQPVGYHFEGWYTDADYTTKAGTPAIPKNSQGAKTFYAKWDPNGYTVNFDANASGASGANGGVTGTVPEAWSCTYNVESNVVPSAAASGLSAIGYTLIGWSTTPITNYESDSSIPEGTQFFEAGTDTFINLATGDGGDTAATLYAVWQMNKYAYVYNLNNGDNVEYVGDASQADFNKSATNIKYTTEQPLPINVPTRIGYEFVGWSHVQNAVEGTDPIYKASTADAQSKVSPKTLIGSTETTQPITLYAQWKAKKLTIAYSPSDGKHEGKLKTGFTGVSGDGETTVWNDGKKLVTQTVTFNDDTRNLIDPLTTYELAQYRPSDFWSVGDVVDGRKVKGGSTILKSTPLTADMSVEKQLAIAQAENENLTYNQLWKFFVIDNKNVVDGVGDNVMRVDWIPLLRLDVTLAVPLDFSIPTGQTNSGDVKVKASNNYPVNLALSVEPTELADWMFYVADTSGAEGDAIWTTPAGDDALKKIDAEANKGKVMLDMWTYDRSTVSGTPEKDGNGAIIEPEGNKKRQFKMFNTTGVDFLADLFPGGVAPTVPDGEAETINGQELKYRTIYDGFIRVDPVSMTDDAKWGWQNTFDAWKTEIAKYGGSVNEVGDGFTYTGEKPALLKLRWTASVAPTTTTPATE